MKRITFFILSILCFTACNNEGIETEKPQTPEPQIQLIFPDAKEVNVYSTATESECKIADLWVLEFTSGGALVNNKFITVGDIVKNGQAAQLLPQLPFKPANSNRVVCIANSGITNIAGLNYGNINTIFPLTSNRYYSGGDYLPMYGELIWGSNNYICEMTRAVAKVQVQMGTSVSDVTTNFSAENVTYRIYNVGYSGHIQPNAGVQGTVINAATTTGSFNLIQKIGAAEAQTHAYIYEFPSSTQTGIGPALPGGPGTTVANSAFAINRQHIILEKDNGANQNTFYRLDFYDPNTNPTPTFLDTKRNHHYIFTINKVRSEGYTTWQQARDNPGGNIEYVVNVGEDAKATSNGQYAIVSSLDTIKVPAGTGAHNGIVGGTVRYQPGAAMTTPLVTSINTMTVSGAGLTVPTTPTAANTLDIVAPYDRVDIVVNVALGFTTGSITFNLGNITHTIPVVRE